MASVLSEKKEQNRMKRSEIVIDILAIALITGFFVFAGLELLFGVEENRMARKASTLVPAFGWALTMWFFMNLMFMGMNRVAFFVVHRLFKVSSNQPAQVNPCNPPENPRIT